MALKNYTSNSRNTFDTIQKCLATHKAQKIMFDYDQQGRIKGLMFALEIGGRQVAFKVPARIEAVELVMYGTNRLDEKRRDQAYRTAWANIRDWITAQMAMVDTQMVNVEEVFLPYAVTKDGATVFEAINNKGFLLPGGDATAE